MDLSAYTENSDVLIWVENALANRTTFLSWKCFYFARIKLNWRYLGTFYIQKKKQLVQSLVYTYQKVV